jgi:hypothetical protein
MTEKSGAKWANGPWRTGRKVPDKIELRAGQRAVLSKTGPVVTWVHDDADAALIAAAPEMYEALDELLRVASAFTHDQLDAKERGRAALAKARGEVR